MGWYLLAYLPLALASIVGVGADTSWWLAVGLWAMSTGCVLLALRMVQRHQLRRLVHGDYGRFDLLCNKWGRFLCCAMPSQRDF